jgi:hypothetical protein
MPRTITRLCLTSLLLSTCAVQAESLTTLLQNPSFEISAPFTGGCDTQNCYNFSIQDWGQAGTSGTFNPSLYAAAGISAFYGNNVAFLSPFAYITQNLKVLTPGQNYSLSVAVAGRADTGPSNYRLGVALPGFSSFIEIAGTALQSVWSIATLNFTAPGNFNTGTAFAYVAADSGGQLLVDSATPEPASIGLILLGLTATFVTKRYRQS